MRSVLRFLLVLLATLGGGCGPPALPDPSSPAYADAVAAFHRGVAAAQIGESGLAAAAFQRVTELAPGEPAGWANLGLIGLQRHELDEAADRLGHALRLSPDDGRILLLAALAESERGNQDVAAGHLRRAVERESNPRARFHLAQTLEADSAGAREALRLIDQVLAGHPGNLAALIARTRLAVRLADTATLRETLARIGARADSLGAPVEPELAALRSAGAAGALGRAATDVTLLQAALQPLAAYQDDQAVVATSPSRVELLFTGFVRLPSPVTRAAAPDTALAFAAESLWVGAARVQWVRPLWLSDEVPLALAAAAGDTLWLSTDRDRAEPIPFPGRSRSPAAVAPLDYDDDFRMDLVLAGSGGVRLLRQRASGALTDVTADALPRALSGGAYAGAWAADLDLEGDMDLVLATVDGPPVVLRNRGDGRFERYDPFPGVTRVRDFAWADLDADGDPDAALLDATGRLHLLLNQRSGVPPFLRSPPPEGGGALLAITVADLDRDATLDLVALRADGNLVRLSPRDGAWHSESLARWPDLAGGGAGAARLWAADLDNNGDPDLVASTPAGSRVWLRGPDGTWPLPSVGLEVTGVADVGSDGRLDLIAVAADGAPHLLVSQGAMDYYSASLSPRAAEVTGDRRINSFGLGGEIELRAGLLYQKRPIGDPVVRFGLGEHPQADVARITWPNGTVQAEFNVSGTNPTILTRQRLKGSCPWVFAFDGEEMRFVTDFIWRTALGLRINAQGNAMVIHSEDWIKIRGDQLAARDGVYDVSITAELWETHYFDHVALMVVDHPESTEVFVDERFRLPAPTPALHAMRPPRPVLGAWDESGRDVTDLVRARDGRFVDTFPLGRYQGLAADHALEVALGDDVPAEGPVWLLASGWVYPTDASINVAITQGAQPALRGLALEIPDGRGGWTTVDDNLGFPSGKSKTVLIPLRGVFRSGGERRLRLRTNMEVYWDEITWAEGLSAAGAGVTTQRLLPDVAELRYRGFSQTTQAGRRAPDLPDGYDRIATGTPVWRDLVGFYTRFGDVRPLNQAVDDRYIIMNAGDELRLRFPAPPPPAPGWTRDFVLIGDGWIKDGDFNSGFSMTVAPLPYHGLTDYSRPPGRLADDPGYRRHPQDWTDFHTRYVTPRAFHRALVPDPER